MLGMLIVGVICFLAGLVLGYCLKWSAKGERKQEALELNMPECYTWCLTCQAMFQGESCPGCTPDQAPEAGYYPGSLADPRN